MTTNRPKKREVIAAAVTDPTTQIVKEVVSRQGKGAKEELQKGHDVVKARADQYAQENRALLQTRAAAALTNPDMAKKLSPEELKKSQGNLNKEHDGGYSKNQKRREQMLQEKLGVTPDNQKISEQAATPPAPRPR
jgi:hypothetical protein